MKPFDIEEGQVSSTPETKGSKKKPLAQIAEQTAVEKVAAALAFASLLTSILALAMVANDYVKLASILSFLLAPYSYFQQTRITDINALKETLAAITEEVDKLNEQNINLRTNVNNLKTTVDKLENIEDALEMITDSETASAQSLLETVDDNQFVLAQMEKNLKAAVLQNILSILLGSDKDMDFALSEEETSGLIHRLNQLRGISVNEAKFREVIKKEKGSLDGVMGMIQESLYNDDIKDPCIIFDS